MKNKRTIRRREKPRIHLVMSPRQAELAQTAVLRFAEAAASCPAHRMLMRRLAMRIDEQL